MMIYSKLSFSKDLEQLLNKKASNSQIAQWAYDTRLSNLHEIDKDVSDILLRLGMMEMGPEFEFTNAELWSLSRQFM